MKPERIEELARLAYEAHTPRNQPWPLLTTDKRAPWLRIARTLYAAAMRDAAGVAMGQKAAEEEHTRLFLVGYYTASSNIGDRLETIAKETDSDNG